MTETLQPPSLEPDIRINDRLTARLLVPDDSQSMFEIMQADPNIHTYITWAAGLSDAEDVRKAIEVFQQNGESRYALVEEGQTIGYVGLFQSPTIEDEYEFGYFCAPDRRGRGIVATATSVLMTEAKKRLGAKSFSLYIQDSNLGSQAVASKLGFGRTEELREDTVLRRMERRYERAA